MVKYLHRKDAKTLFSGGGASPEYPTVLEDNLISGDWVEVLMGLCEGPIEGLVDGGKSFYIDSTPLVSNSGSKNYQKYELNVYRGDPATAKPIELLLGAEAPISVGSANLVLSGYDSDDPYDIADWNNDECPRVKYVLINQFDDFDYIDFRLTLSQLLHASSSGDQTNGSFSFNVKWQYEGATDWVDMGVQTVTGKTTTGYYKDFRIWLPKFTENERASIRLRFVCTLDKPGTSGNQYNAQIGGISVGNSSKEYNFHNTACVKFLTEASDRISGTPEVWGVYNLAIISIPSNYDGHAHTYDGDWDGLFKKGWTNNPAWILYDLLTNSRYGMGSFYNFDVDKMDFYDAAQFCDELVDDGNGNFVPRYTWNGLIDQQKMGREVVMDVAASFNATLFEDNSGAVRLKIPRDDDAAVHIFSPSNVIDGLFNYSYTDPSMWYNSVSVTFINEAEDWIQDQRVVEDEEAIAKYGKNETSANLIGCTSVQEAVRKAWYALLTYTTETLSVNFVTTREGLNCNIGDVILISDPDMNSGQSGRLTSVSEDRLTAYLRDDMFIESAIVGGGINYFCDFQVGDKIISYEVIPDGVGYVKSLKFSIPLDDRIGQYTVYTIRTSELTDTGNAKPYRVTSIKEVDGSPDKISIGATEINRLKQKSADQKSKLEAGEYQSLVTPTTVPHILGLEFDEYFDKEEKCAYLDLIPELDATYKYYSGGCEVYWRPYGETAWNKIEHIYDATVKNPPIGAIEWTLLPYNTLGYLPDLETAPAFRYDTYNINEPPRNVQNLKGDGGLTKALITWDPVQDADLMCYEIREGETWDTGTVLSFSTTNPQYEYFFKDLEKHTIWVKAKDIIGTYSEIAMGITIEAGRPKNVKNFYVTTNNDRPRFDWDSTGEDVYYEVRTGNSTWESGTKICSTTGTGYTSLYPITGEYTGFFIKTRSQLGAYCEQPVYTEFSMELMKDRNEILKIDNTQPTRAYGWVEFTSMQASESGAQRRLPRNPIDGESITVADSIYVFGTDIKIGDTLERTLHNAEVAINKVDTKVTVTNDGMTRLTLVSQKLGREGNSLTFSTTAEGAVTSGSNLSNGMDSWDGVTEGFVRYESAGRDVIQMDDGVSYAEHYFPVHLDQVTRARNWFESESFKFGQPLYFADLSYPWDSQQAHETSWLNSSVTSKEEGSAQAVICWKEPDRYPDPNSKIGLPLDGTLEDIKGSMNPTSTSEINYGANRLTQGLILNRMVDAQYSMKIPETFALRFTVKLTSRSINYYEVLVLKDASNTNWLKIVLENNTIVCLGSDGVVLRCPFARSQNFDYIYVQISQDESSRRLSYGVEKTQDEGSDYIEANPIGSFDGLILGDDKIERDVPLVLPKYTFTIEPEQEDATVIINGKERKSITVDSGTIVYWSVSLDGYVSQSGQERITKNKILSVDLVSVQEMDYTIQIRPNPMDAKVIINGEERDTFTARWGTEITWSVSSVGYVEQTGTLTLTESIAIPVFLTKKIFNFSILPTPSNAKVTINDVETTSVSVEYGTVVSYSVSSLGYHEQTGSLEVVEDTVLPISLNIKQFSFEINALPSGATVVINGEERTSIVADYGTNIEWVVSAPNRESKSGSLILTEDTSLNVSLDASEHTFVIVVVPSDAIVKINGVVRNSFVAAYGTSISWSVSRENYITQSGTLTLTEDTSIEVSLELKSYTFTVSPTPANALVIINGEERTSITSVHGTEIEWSVSADNYISQNGTLTLTEDTTLPVALSLVQHTFTIVPTPADAIVTINGKTTNTITADYGTSINWKVSAVGHETKEGSLNLTEDVTLSVELSLMSVVFTIVPTPADAFVTINGEETNSITAIYGDSVSWTVSKSGYTAQSGDMVLTEDTTLNVELELEELTFTIVPTPTDAIVTINGVNRTTFTAPAGTSVDWSVSASGYATQSGTLTLTESKTLSVVLEVIGVQKIAIGGNSTVLVLYNNGELFGAGSKLPLGLGSSGTQKSFVKIADNVKDFSASGTSTFYITNDDYLYGCGSNTKNQQGNGSTSAVTSFAKKAENVKSVYCSDETTFYITNEGELFGCGSGSNGQQGNGGTSNVRVFTKRADNVQSVSCQSNSTFYITNAGELYGCGVNTYGQQGDESTTDVTVFTKRADNVKKFISGYTNTVYLTNDGDLYGCGGSLALGGESAITEFTKIAESIKDFSVGMNSMFYINNAGELYGCGINAYGGQGDGTTTTVKTFTKRADNVKKVITGYVTFYLTNDGELFGCGHNARGQQGDGTTNNVTTFTKRADKVKDFVVNSGDNITFYVTEENEVFGCGYNSSGQQGDGTTTHLRTFTKKTIKT